MKSSGYSALSAPYGYVYEIVNLQNGKTYVGSRKLARDVHWRQYMGSGKLIRQAIAKYGSDSFIKRFIGYGTTPELLYELETEWIVRQKSLGLAQYNLFTGGHAGGDTFSKLKSKTLEEVRKLQSNGVKRHLQTATVWNSGETAATDPRLRAKVERAVAKGTYRGMHLGRKRSAETRAKLSEASKGNTNGHSNRLEENRVRTGVFNKRKLQPSGLTGIELHDEMLVAIKSFNPSQGTLRAFARLHGYSYTTIRKFSYSHGVTDRGEDCLLCIARDRYPELLAADERSEG